MQSAIRSSAVFDVENCFEGAKHARKAEISNKGALKDALTNGLRKSNRQALGDIGNIVQSFDSERSNPLPTKGSKGGLVEVPPAKQCSAGKAAKIESDASVPDEALLDVDAVHRWDATCVAPYAQQIVKHMKDQEIVFAVSADFLDRQEDISGRMRAILVDWLVEVHHRFKLRQETLYLAINYLNRFLAKKQVRASKLQLLGTTCMWLACKFEEIYQPEIGDFEFITDKTCLREDLLEMEMLVVNTLEFELCVPTAYRFLERFLAVDELTPTPFMVCMAQFFLDCTLGEVLFVNWHPSQLAAAAVYLTKKACKQDPSWSEKMELYTGYEQAMIRKPAKEMCGIINSIQHSQYQAVRIKYASEKYRGVSKEIVPGTVPQCSTAGRTITKSS
eukprot:Filipodium_phascolosomae@DN2657_c0_g1_i4.p1